jgi:ATP-dependent helicase HepA
MTFTIGQRWISNTESQLGLGFITGLQGRQVSISFPAAEEERIYAIDNAPLSRIIYREGEEIVSHDQQKIQVIAVKEEQGLIVYTGTDESGNELKVKEVVLSCFIKFSTPEQRLFSGLLDKFNAFKLRIKTLDYTSRLQQSTVRGLLGSRTNHLAHQVFIASQVAQRYAPRVLLADEVGLGKTIEAGMILHYQLHTGRANRVLIVVPDTLIHQWLVEMIRRFNLYFSIFDQSRYDVMHTCDELDDIDAEPLETTLKENLFESEQLILCSLDFLMANKKAREHAVACNWDLLIVDEAHHLQWSEENISPEYACIEQLSAQSKGLLLLTATPEQVGIESHFARLRLLDPSRFYDFSIFKKEETSYQETNKLVQKLIEHRDNRQNDELSSELKSQLHKYLGEDLSIDINDAIKNLLDRHGTGRVLFRNTRAAIKGFPERTLHPYPLPRPSLYPLLDPMFHEINLFPESTLDNELWLEEDPRVNWLISRIEQLYPQKVLVICAKSKTATALEKHLKLKAGIRSAAFHEGLSIIDRDKAAAYFSEAEQGAQALICSEIGSEGRNFQFSHHLVLFDLPLNPDLLEQRIGRLDRIGQKHTIEIHVPYILNTPQELLFRWYHEGINLFEKSCSVGFSIFESFKDRLLPLLPMAMDDTNKRSFDVLIMDTRLHTAHLNQMLHEGRDKLLEMNSCDLPVAKELIDAIEGEENCLELENYMAEIFQEYGIEHEFHSDNAEILRPSDHMKTSHFPGLTEEGMTVTYSRTKALAREDMQFLSWEHPMVHEAMEMILNSELGNATITTISVKNIQPGTLFLETFYTAHYVAPKELQLDRFLPATPIRILMDVTGKNLSKILSFTQLNEICQPVKRHLAYPIVKQIRDDLTKILKDSNKTAEEQMQLFIERAQTEMKRVLGHEVSRLEALQKINPNIREEEVAFFKQQGVDSEYFIKSATLKLQALRVIVNK